MNVLVKTSVSIAVASLLSGCASTFADRITYDDEVNNAYGTILLSDPKLFNRESLIFERNADVTWYNQLLEESKDRKVITFKPELIREVEQIKVLASALGLKFDPAAALNYQYDKAEGAIQHQIDVTKLKLQLAQLERDTELIRQQLQAQTELVNDAINRLDDTATREDLTTSDIEATDLLKEAIQQLTTAITNRFDASPAKATTSDTSNTPFDDFRDRNAYRDLLKSARNAAQLDNLHDYNGFELVRMNFQATVIPDPENPSALGVVEMEVMAPSSTSKEMKSLLNSWLQYVNTDREFRDKNSKGKRLNRKNSNIIALLRSSNFTIVNINGIELLLPVYDDNTETGRSPRNSITFASSLNANFLDSARQTLTRQDGDQYLAKYCSSGNSGDQPTDKVLDESILPFRNYAGYLDLAEQVKATFLEAAEVSANINEQLLKLNTFRDQALFRMLDIPECQSLHALATKDETWAAFSDPFKATDGITQPIRIYQVGPREQVQYVSTVARSANNLSLAVSLAASDPSSGVGAASATSYSNQSMGKATANERVPSVVGYSQRGTNSFGWVIGPRAVLNANGRVDMSQLLKAYDLTVDLSVPGWWPYMEVQHTSVWAPAPTLLAKGLNSDSALQESLTPLNPSRIPLRDNSAKSNETLTRYFTVPYKKPRVEEVLGWPANFCEETNVMISGDYLWRATEVFYRGLRLDKTHISMTPYMDAIIVKFPKQPKIAADTSDNRLVIMTPIGNATKDMGSSPLTDCPKKPASNQSDTNSLEITGVTPSAFNVPAQMTIRIDGQALEKLTEVRLNGQKGELEELKPGSKAVTTRDLLLTEAITSSVRESESSYLEFYFLDSKGKKVRLPNRVFVRTIINK